MSLFLIGGLELSHFLLFREFRQICKCSQTEAMFWLVDCSLGLSRSQLFLHTHTAKYTQSWRCVASTVPFCPPHHSLFLLCSGMSSWRSVRTQWKVSHYVVSDVQHTVTRLDWCFKMFLSTSPHSFFFALLSLHLDSPRCLSMSAINARMSLQAWCVGRQHGELPMACRLLANHQLGPQW